MIRTRVGYAGGSTPDPTYYNLGDHTETVQIDFDPSQISYRDLLDVFWAAHNPTRPARSCQYKSVVFYHDMEQKRLAEETRDQRAAEWGREVFTEIVPVPQFYRAENYHQKYYLQNVPAIATDLRARFPDHDAFVDSTAAARVNGYLGGHGTCEELQATIDDLELSEPSDEMLVGIVCRGR